MKMSTEASKKSKQSGLGPMALILKLLRQGPAIPKLTCILLLVWGVSIVLSIPLGGFYAFDEAFVIATVYKLAALGLTFPLAYRLLAENKHERYLSFRKFLGYSGVVGYFAMAMPALAWEDAAYLTHEGALWLWAVDFWNTALLSAIWITLFTLRGRAHFGLITQAEIKDRKLRNDMRKKRESKRPRRKVWRVVTENVDQFIQVVLSVIVLQTFIFQLYVIPSESLVPTMLIGDRPFVVKTLDGPPMPLSNVRFPAVSNIERNNIVVFESPAAPKMPLMKQVFNQFVFLLTLSLVNLDTDDKGAPVERMIVKRVIGLPGERLMMVDDKVYVSGADGNFRPLAGDEQHAFFNLQRLPDDIRSQIKYLPISESTRQQFDLWDAKRKNIDLGATAQDTKTLAETIRSNLSRISKDRMTILLRNLGNNSVDRGQTLANDYIALYKNEPWRYWATNYNYNAVDHPEVFAEQYRNIVKFRTERQIGGVQDDDALTVFALWQRKDLLDRFTAFLTGTLSPASNDVYGQAVNSVEALYRNLTARRFAALSKIWSSPIDPGAGSSPEYSLQVQTAGEFTNYLDAFDERNFPAFPASGTIPEGHYFLMGDNRYNSLDFRFEMHGIRSTRSLNPADSNSLIYLSMLAPRLLERERIVGHVVFRLFPLNRIGAVP